MTPLLFRQMLDTLHEAQEPVRSEVEKLARVPVDPAALLRLEEAARSFQEQAHSLLVSMHFQDAEPALVVEAEALVSFFGEVLSQIGAVRAAPRG